MEILMFETSNGTKLFGEVTSEGQVVRLYTNGNPEDIKSAIRQDLKDPVCGKMAKLYLKMITILGITIIN